MLRVTADTITRSFREGDILKVNGVQVEIGEILSQDCYVDEFYRGLSTEKRSQHRDGTCINLEFKDKHGHYRHWKSSLDGGYFEYKPDESEEIQKLVSFINDYYKGTGLSLKHCIKRMEEFAKPKNIYKAIVIALGDLVWEE